MSFKQCLPYKRRISEDQARQHWMNTIYHFFVLKEKILKNKRNVRMRIFHRVDLPLITVKRFLTSIITKEKQKLGMLKVLIFI